MENPQFVMFTIGGRWFIGAEVEGEPDWYEGVREVLTGWETIEEIINGQPTGRKGMSSTFGIVSIPPYNEPRRMRAPSASAGVLPLGTASEMNDKIKEALRRCLATEEAAARQQSKIIRP